MKPIPKRHRKPIPKSHRSSSRQALIEFALILPVLFLPIVNVINFGGMLHARICVSHAARTGVQYMVMGGATVTAPKAPTAAQAARLERRSFKEFLAAAQARGNS